VTPGRWKQVESIFEQALDLPQEDRAKFLNRNCDGDQELRCEVKSLLDSHASAGLFIDEPSLFILDEDTKQEERGIAPGQLLGAYRILREIGRGGMGAVYLAERADEQYKKLVAIKLIKRGMDTDAVLRRFRNERQILAGFDHPNIARLFDGGTTHGGLPYFVMEHVEGMPINEYCAAHKISLVERLKLFREVCAAVSYAHRHTVIHRDIKMSNILVTSDGTPKLLDFGIAKILRPDNAAESMLTFTGMRPMTPEYASPEQVRGEAVTTASDVYSLGVVLYELLTGTSPYQLTTHAPRDVEHAITEQEPKKPSTVAREPRFESRESSDSRFTIDNSRALRGDLDNIVLMALRKEAARRYQTVEQFADDICRHLEERPVLARRDTFGYRAAKFIQRNKVATIAAVLILVSLVVGLIMTTWEAHRAKLEKTRAEERFKDVRQLAHSVLFDYHDAIKDLPGATHVRERLVKDALTYLDKLAAEATGDPGLQRELASAYERVGDVRGQAYGASLGDMTGAMESYLKALLIREALVAANPKEVQSRRDLTRSYVRIGRQLIETNEAARGTNYLRKALAICVQLSVEQAASTEILSDLASAYNELGISLEDWWGDASGALENHRKALALREKFVAADPENQIHQRNLSVTYVNLSRALVLSGDIKGGLESNGKALAIRRALSAANPNNADYRRLLAITYQNDGDRKSVV